MHRIQIASGHSHQNTRYKFEIKTKVESENLRSFAINKCSSILYAHSKIHILIIKSFRVSFA